MTVSEFKKSFDINLFAARDDINAAYNEFIEIAGDSNIIASFHILMRTIAVDLKNDE